MDTHLGKVSNAIEVHETSLHTESSNDSDRFLDCLTSIAKSQWVLPFTHCFVCSLRWASVRCPLIFTDLQEVIFFLFAMSPSPSTQIPSSILVIGSGVFGLATVDALCKRPEYRDTKIVLIDRLPFPAPDGASVCPVLNQTCVASSRTDVNVSVLWNMLPLVPQHVPGKG